MTLFATALTAVILSGAPAQAAAAPAPAAQPAGRLFVLETPAKLHFSVPTSIGPVEGTVDVVRVDGRGVEGWGRFDLRIVVDPGTVDTGDALRDRHIARAVLGHGSGNLFIGATDRLPPQAAPEGGYILGASAWMDARRGRKHVELRYRWKPGGGGGVFSFEHEATLEELGLPPPQHPFVHVTGPVKLRLSAPLVRPG